MVLFTEVSSHYSYMHVMLCNYYSSDIHTCTRAQAHTNKRTNKTKYAKVLLQFPVAIFYNVHTVCNFCFNDMDSIF